MQEVIIYGAGVYGRRIVKFCICNGYDGIACVVDNNYLSLDNICGIEVKSPDVIEQLKLPVLVLIRKDSDRNEIINKLRKISAKVYSSIDDWIMQSGADPIKWHRDYVAFIHREDMQDYYNIAEDEQNIRGLWDDDSLFFKLFTQLDLENIVELACGHGRHVKEYINKATNVILIDVLSENIEYCKNRYSNYNNVQYYVNNGYDLREIEDRSVSALFCYDAMVHFEMLDIFSYLKEIYRVLSNGGRALIHHSNQHTDPFSDSFVGAVHARSFMSKELFAYFSHRTGFKILRQEIIDWCDMKGLDCLTLLEKE